MKHVDRLIDDYILGLASSEERQTVETHLASCHRCRRLLAAERARTTAIIQTLRRATTAPTGRLDSLWPQVAFEAGVVEPRRRAPNWTVIRAVATAVAVVVFVLVGVQRTMHRFDGWFLSTFTPTANAGTSEVTPSSTPTASLTPGKRATEAVALWATPEVSGLSPEPQPIPRAPTPGGE